MRTHTQNASIYTTCVIACGNLKTELEGVRAGDNRIEVRYMDHDLHRCPERMPAVLQSEIDAVESYASRVVLGYGLCSYGTTGITAPAQGLWLPLVHDCVALFLGSRVMYHREFQGDPGTYYLTEAWISHDRDPLGIIEKDYAPRVGYDTALWAMKQELKHYNRIAFVNTECTGNVTSAKTIERAKENARLLNKEYAEIEGHNEFFRRILFGPYSDEDFVYVEPGVEIERRTFECSKHATGA